MSSPVETISKDATVREAAQLMRDKEISSLLVPAADMGVKGCFQFHAAP